MTESEVPTLGLGAEQRQMWTQAVMTMAYGVRERRHALGRLAWSDEQTAERTHERTQRRAGRTALAARARPAGLATARAAARLDRHVRTGSLRTK